MLGFHSHQRFYVYTADTDMRCGYNSLSGIIRNELQSDPVNSDVYIFFNKPRDIIKMLVWDGDGFVLYYKKLEKGRFEKLVTTDKKYSIRYDHLVMLIGGISLQKVHQRKRFALNKNNDHFTKINT